MTAIEISNATFDYNQELTAILTGFTQLKKQADAISLDTTVLSEYLAFMPTLIADVAKAETEIATLKEKILLDLKGFPTKVQELIDTINSLNGDTSENFKTETAKVLQDAAAIIEG